MAERIRPADFRNLHTHPLERRRHKIHVGEFGRAVDAEASLADFVDGLGDVLAAKELRELATRIVTARDADHEVIWACGAHVVKVGLAPVLIRLMERGRITALVLNGAAAIHDWEVAAVGGTSEAVDETLVSGHFGMAHETGEALHRAADEARRTGAGLGEVLGRQILSDGLPHRDASILATAARQGLPATVHVSIGSDVVHLHPRAEGESIGAASFTDFRRLVSLVGRLSEGVWINCGSAVQLPEVLLKALNGARNLGHAVEKLTTANLDMIRHYRTEENVLRRPTRPGGKSFNLIGHHEINVPLLAAAIEIAARRD